MDIGKAKTANSGNLNKKTFKAMPIGSPDSIIFLTRSKAVSIVTPMEEKAPTPNKNGGSSSLAK
ncbi:hypothetical protein PCC6912_55930 [Chlorogloeopsis fritschii PCC 6912]|uniref:Uncharacterized protein n=1 Tax=Chlorogloeopsis fritschii PCC 6912 TaxID=211165 RepID=A0A3S0XNV6_CHLFR|nr:hypothetical protein PCC6912_55930 [Chlorogloeopsis fritschii PCC 6912]